MKRIEVGLTGRRFLVFNNNMEAEEFCELNGFEMNLSCFGQYENAICLDALKCVMRSVPHKPYAFKLRLTKAQMLTVQKKWKISNDGAKNYYEFRRRVIPDIGDCIGLPWCGQYVGIEADGYPHT